MGWSRAVDIVLKDAISWDSTPYESPGLEFEHIIWAEMQTQ